MAVDAILESLYADALDTTDGPGLAAGTHTYDDTTLYCQGLDALTHMAATTSDIGTLNDADSSSQACAKPTGRREVRLHHIVAIVFRL